MIYQLLCVSLMISMVMCNQKVDQKVEDEKQSKDQELMKQFFDKYCKETDQAILAKLEKCEDTQPKQLKDIETECVKKVLKKTTEPTYKEVKQVECDDTLGQQFDECENEKMKTLPDAVKNNKSISEIATKIMHCGFDCYGIKYQ